MSHRPLGVLAGSLALLPEAGTLLLEALALLLEAGTLLLEVLALLTKALALLLEMTAQRPEAWDAGRGRQIAVLGGRGLMLGCSKALRAEPGAPRQGQSRLVCISRQMTLRSSSETPMLRQ